MTELGTISQTDEETQGSEPQTTTQIADRVKTAEPPKPADQELDHIVSALDLSNPKHRKALSIYLGRRLYPDQDINQVVISELTNDRRSDNPNHVEGENLLKVELPGAEAKYVIKFVHKERLTDDRLRIGQKHAQADLARDFYQNLQQHPDPQSPFVEVIQVFNNEQDYGLVMPAYEQSAAQRLSYDSAEALDQLPLEWAEMGEMVSTLGVGAIELEERGYTHPDFSLDDLMQRDDGRYVLLDMDLIGNLKQPETQGRFKAVGTLKYMAPETFQTKEEDDPINDEQSNVYSLGTMVYEIFLRGKAVPYQDPPDPQKPYSMYAEAKMKTDNNYHPLVDLFFEPGSMEAVGTKSPKRQLFDKISRLDQVLSQAVGAHGQRYESARAFFVDLAAVWDTVSQQEYAYLWQDYARREPKTIKPDAINKNTIRRLIDRFKKAEL